MVEIWDVAIHLNDPIFSLDQSKKDGIFLLHKENKYTLSDDLWVGRLDPPTADLILKTCETGVYNVPGPLRQNAQFYAFVRTLDSESAICDWDSDSKLQMCIALSRLIHPTSIGYGCAVRLRRSGDDIQIYQPRIEGVSKEAWLSPQGRDWLTVEDLDLLRGILVKSFPLPIRVSERISRALWYHEYASRTQFLDLRWMLVSSALEALVHTDRVDSTRQFAYRVSEIAASLGVTSFDESIASSAYDVRSRLSHGGKFTTSPEESTYQAMEETLRKTVLKCIQEDKFAEIFADDDSVRRQWPLPKVSKARKAQRRKP